MIFKRLTSLLTALSVLLIPSAALAGGAPKPAKTEVEKATGKCVGSVLAGALLGGLLGRAVGGKKGTAAGAAIGVAGGAAICGMLMASAKHKDRIIQAQMAAALQPGRPYTATWTDDDGRPVTYVTTAGASRTIEGSSLSPVRYPTAGGDAVSPALDTGGRECRPVSGTMMSVDASAATPDQLVCRTATGDWQPYAEART